MFYFVGAEPVFKGTARMGMDCALRTETNGETEFHETSRLDVKRAGLTSGFSKSGISLPEFGIVLCNVACGRWKIFVGYISVFLFGVDDF